MASRRSLRRAMSPELMGRRAVTRTEMRDRPGQVTVGGGADGIRDRAAETPIARGVYLARLPQVAPVEIGPQRVKEYQFRVGGLPEQEVRQPLLPRRPHEQVHIGNIRFVQVAREKPLVDLV